MKYLNIVFICISALILTSTLSKSVSKNKSKNKALMAAMTETASKFLSKQYNFVVQGQLCDELFKHIFVNDVPIEGTNPKQTCQMIITEAVKHDFNLLLPEYFKTFSLKGDLEQDLLLRIRLFFDNQQFKSIKDCKAKVINKNEPSTYDKASTELKPLITDILKKWEFHIKSSSTEFISSIISVHRELATKSFYQRLNHEEPTG